jgi:formate hydrogenlyase transcriptional activator
VRLIAATNRDLEVSVKEQKFRSDLYYRLNVFPVRIPPLLRAPTGYSTVGSPLCAAAQPPSRKDIDTIPLERLNTLLKYPWPGNIRELQNVLERAVILTPGSVLKISSEDLSTPDSMPIDSQPSPSGPKRERRTPLDDDERQQILAALEQANWTVAGPHGAAARPGMKRSTLQSRIQRLGIHILRQVG